MPSKKLLDTDAEVTALDNALLQWTTRVDISLAIKPYGIAQLKDGHKGWDTSLHTFVQARSNGLLNQRANINTLIDRLEPYYL
jgi:hypothetical protein